MKRQNLTFEVCLTLAKEFLTTKERENYYEFKTFDDEMGVEHLWLNALTDENVADIRVLKEEYGEKFVEHLDDVFDDPDVIQDFSCGEELLDIDLDHVYHEYLFLVHEYRPDQKVAGLITKIELRDEQYAKLVALHLYDNNFSINLLRYRDRELYDVVMAGADARYCTEGFFFEADCPYLVTMKEAKEDAELIIKKHGIERIPGYRGLMKI